MSVDGEVVDRLGSKVRPDAHIVLNESGTEEQAQLATSVTNKPIGYVSGQPEEGPFSLIEEKNQWKGGSCSRAFSYDQLNGGTRRSIGYRLKWDSWC